MGHTTGDIEARFEMALNEDFAKAVKRLSELEPLVKAMDPTQAEIVSKEVNIAADYIERFGPISEIKSYFVDVKGFSEADFKRIENILKKEDPKSIDAIKSYIQSPRPIEYFTNITATENIVSMVSKDTGISQNFIKELFSMDGSMKSGKGVGRGELFLGFMVDGATNASVGDVNANGSPYEVKARSARLNTQNGFGNGIAAVTKFFDEFAKIDKELAAKFKPKSKDDFAAFNFTKNGGSRFYDLLEEAYKLKIDLNKIYKLQADTLYCSSSGIWSNGDTRIKKLIVDNLTNNINKNGSVKDDDALNYEFMYINILYYQSQEFFNGIFLIEPNKGLFVYFDPSMNKRAAVKWLSKYTKYTQPSWQDNPTSNCWKITLK
jgi:hypothetical protein